MTSSTDPPPLKWSSQFTVIPASRTPPLKGDRIILPQLALEQLLSAATTTVKVDAPARTSDFDPFNPYSVAAARQSGEDTFEKQQNLPHPLTFRLVNPENGRIVYAGIREFSAGDDEIGISAFLRESLGTGQKVLHEANSRNGNAESLEESSGERLTVHVQELQKGTYVRLRPLEAGYDPEDWKALLERYLRDNFTTLTNGEILSVSAGKEEYRFLVDQLKPSSEAVSLIDTDIEVDIEALNEEQARETLKQRMKKIQRAPGTNEGSSVGGIIALNESISGQVRPAEHVDYTLEDWDRTQSLEISLTSDDVDDDIDLYVSPTGPKQRARPREEEHVFSELSTKPSKRIKINPTNTALENAEALWVSIGSYRDTTDDPSNADQGHPFRFHLTISSAKSTENETELDMLPDEAAHTDETKCKNCHQWVPSRTMILHENFCFRNNILCPHCSNVFQKSSPEWKNHWHCPHDDSHGSTPASHQKHDTLFHTPRSCTSCGYQAKNTPDLAHHRTTTCPQKPILCSFCHLLVPQQGPDDPAATDPEVILSGLTPHELTDGARTTECHLCGKIVRLRAMATHLKHHDLQRLSRPTPRLCRNINCGRVLDSVSKTGEVRTQSASEGNEIGVCETCFGPLYVSMYDPEGKALRRRVERRYLTQILTGCGQEWCANGFCKSGRRNTGVEVGMSSKEGMVAVRPFLDGLKGRDTPVHFCVDEGSRRRRALGEMMAAEGGGGGGGGEREGGGSWKGKGKEVSGGSGYELEWCIAALNIEGGDIDKARAWLKGFAPTRAEASR
ncbi:MAG: hypothetical protein HETSPECPRED_007515 [Heterodermia speciosa]|uniref:Ubiquitin-protein ligase E3A N-terminal zinc-binding domain-containing protein n=1 Tax=Heterodermia speciosa TaxID=116794 RepID=A0A8H3FRY1_9LECA|nr:MAG: hypothetical protein HETSPECPRED_007515 [Heterodermia speciosa]